MAHFRVTPETAFRNPAGFEPKLRQDRTLVERLRRIERLDQDLHRYEATVEGYDRLLRRSLARNAFGTASIEGNPLSLAEVESLLAAAPSAVDVQPDEREILNWKAFMEDLDVPFPTEVDQVLALHALLFEGVLKERGQLKRRQNYVVQPSTQTVHFVPSAPKTTRGELQALLTWVQRSPHPPLVRAALFFHEFQGIHPFSDGNGRIGRALFTWLLHSEGYRGIRYAPVDYAFNADRASYYENLAIVERNGYDYTPWVEYLAWILERSYEDSTRRFHILEDHPRLPERQQALLEWFIRVQGPTRRALKLADAHAAFPHVPRRSLQRDLAGLHHRGILMRTGTKRGATYRLATIGQAS